MTNYDFEPVIRQRMKDSIIPGAVVLVEKAARAGGSRPLARALRTCR
jgi:hypothetical protein